MYVRTYVRLTLREVKKKNRRLFLPVYILLQAKPGGKIKDRDLETHSYGLSEISNSLNNPVFNGYLGNFFKSKKYHYNADVY